jgi:hypothetical protein
MDVKLTKEILGAVLTVLQFGDYHYCQQVIDFYFFLLFWIFVIFILKNK